MQLVSMIINIAIAVMSPVSWLMIVFGMKDNVPLADRGIKSLKYFTVLSNLFSGIVSAFYGFALLQGGWPPSLPLTVLRLAATSAVMLTFLTVVLLLIPTYGVKALYEGGNLWMHLILPLMALFDCVFYVPVAGVPFWLTLCAMIPTFLYGVFYLSRIIIHGGEQNGIVYDHYDFLRWGEKRIPVVAVGMLGVSWLIALVLCLINRLITGI